MNISIVYFGCIAATALMAGIALKSNYRSSVNRSFFLLSCTVVCWMAFLYLMYSFEDSSSLSLTFTRLANGIGLFIVLAFAEFFYQFPKKTFKINKTIRLIGWVITSGLFLMVSFTSLVQESITIKNGEILNEVLGPLFSLYVVYSISLLVLGLVFAAKKIINTRGVEKKKIQYAVGGFTLAMIGVITTNMILPIFGIIAYVEESIIFSLLFIIPTFYSIYKHRFFNPSYTYLNLLRELVLVSVLVSMMYINFMLIKTLIPSINFLIANVIAFIPSKFVFNRAGDYLPVFTTESFRKFQKSIIKLKSKLYYCDSYNKLQNLLEDQFVLSLNISATTTYLIRKKQVEIGIPVYTKNDFTKELIKYKNDVLVFEEIKFGKSVIKRSLISAMKDLGSSICMPLFSDQKLIGFFVLGSKLDNKPYAKEEIEEIMKIRPGLETAFMNIIIKKNLQEDHNLMKGIIEKKTKKLKKQIERINELMKQQSDFLAVTTHEFRTPLSIAMFQLEDTLSSRKHPTEVLEEMKTIEDSLHNLKSLMQKLFDVQQYDLDKVQLNKVQIHLETFLFETYKSLKLMMAEKKIELSFENKLDSDVFLNVDESQLRQVLHNIIENAGKFANKINLCVEEKDDNAIIKVIDNGKGIPDSDKKRVFEKFQTQNSAMGIGIGLGLYICKKTIELHDGKIWVEDGELGGSVFCIQLKATKNRRDHKTLKGQKAMDAEKITS